MRSLIKLLAVTSLLLFSSSIFAEDAKIPVITIEMNRLNQIKSVSGVDNSLMKLTPPEASPKLKLKSKKRLQKKLNKTIKKLSKIVSKAMKMDANSNSKYELTEVSVSVALSSEYGLNDVFAVGGGGGIVLQFVKD